VAARLRDVQLEVPAVHFEDEVARWADLLGARGASRSEDGRTARLLGPMSPFGIHLVRTDADRAGAHLELESHDRDTEVRRLVALGATVGAAHGGVTELADPAGLRFHLHPWGAVVEELRDRRGDEPGVEYVVIDVPTGQAAATARFWQQVLGGAAHPLPAPNEAYVYLTSFSGPGGPAHGLVQDVGPDTAPGVHLDLHTDSWAGRDRAVARLTAGGAERVHAVQHWVTLRTPAGHLLCVFPDHRDHEDDT
jgi:hypothetical protein